MQHKTGIGYDIHAFGAGRRLFLAGVEIPYDKGLEGHSDADVVLHAVCDAILGACGKGDIGEHFSNTDDQYKNISSVILLEKVIDMMSADGYRVGNLDVVIQAQEPNLNQYKEAMCQLMADKIKVERNAVNVKATTLEGLGSLGKAEGIAAFANVLLVKD